MKFFVATLSALLAVASAVPIYEVMPVHRAGYIGGYGDAMDMYKSMKYMSGDILGTGREAYNPMYMLWAGMGGMHNTGMGVYGPYSPLYHHYGLMGMGDNLDLHHSIGMNWYPGMLNYGVYGGGLAGDMLNREWMDKMFYKHGWNTVDKMMCYHTYGIERCHIMLMHMIHKIMPHMMLSHMIY